MAANSDIIGLGDDGVWTVLDNGDGTFQESRLVLDNFCYNKAWRVETHPRFVLVVNNDDHADIV
jgi:hypothetical protein